ncbi:MAG TPA: putative Ig domain-containing protein, partial [Candidatus Sulfotelmatobacter sp.]|nr:putative Ig domain-containing protein [Candidatus Sulfotelmatobacter sp.]
GATRFVAYRDSVSASGGAPPYVYSISAGALPSGLALDDSTGVISGTPGAFGTFQFAVLATDVAGCSGNRAYTLVVSSGCPAISILPASLPDGSLTVAYSQTLTASAGHAPYTFAVTAGALPGGLALATGGLLSGMPTAPDSAGFTVTATDSNGCTGSREYTLVIHALPAAVGNLAALQTQSGNDNDGTVRIQVTFTMPPGATSAEVYRAGFGHYPQYDDAGGTVPALPSYPPSSPWVLTAVNASGQFDEPASRDFYYYVAFVKNAGGGRSAVSNRSNGALNYHLGDVSDGVTAGAGNNHVGDEDISLLGAHYGITEPAISAAGVAYLDVGPTTDLQVTSRPFTDHRIDFEDLIVFATNYEAVSGPALLARATRAAPLSSAGAGPLAPPPANEDFTIQAPALVDAGATFGAALSLDAGGRVQGFSAHLAWNASVVEPVGYESGGFVEGQGGVVLSPAAGVVDGALLGARERGLSGSGTVAVVRFRALRAGDPGIRIAAVVARDRFNRDVVTEERAAVLRPARTELMAAAPNPARGRTRLEFSLSDPGDVELSIFGVDGRRVRTLAKGTREPGVYHEIWDGSDDGGRVVAPGIYYVHLVAGGRRFVKSLAYLR